MRPADRLTKKRKIMFYIISLKHTHPDETYVTLWRPDNSGYCCSMKNAGIYDAPIKGYHDSYDSVPVSVEMANSLCIEIECRPGENEHFIPNNKKTWNRLGFEVKDKKLVPINVNSSSRP